MRKILTSVLSVAGLLAVVLALASSPASAAKEVVTIQTGGTPSQAGTYTVSWETQGGCDPGSGTSGASGSVTLTVADADGAGTETTGPQQETGVVTDDVCNYSWSATFTNAAGAACVVGGTGTTGTTAEDLEPTDAGLLSLITAECAVTAKITVTVQGDGTNVGDCIPRGDGVGTHDDAVCATANTDTPPTGTYRFAIGEDADSANVGAANATTFTITATPEPPTPGGKVPEGCNAVSEDTETEYDDANNPRQEAELTVVATALGGANCLYTVTAALPSGFAAGDGSPRNAENVEKGQDPGSLATDGGPDGDTGTTEDNNDIEVELTVSIASVKVYLVQNVIGDAGGAGASYDYKAPCGTPGLPGALEAAPVSTGITTVKGKKVVELRTGRFNISGALPDGSAEDGTSATALDNEGNACEATIAVSDVPSHCSISHNSPASLATDDDSVILEVTIDCSAPEPPAPPADDDMDDGEDMSGTDDMDDGEDMSGDDMDDGEDMNGTDDMGPPQDTPTG